MTKLNFERARMRSRPSYENWRYGPAPREGNCPPAYGPPPPNLKFKGSFRLLQAIAESTGLDGKWSESNLVKVYRTEEGGVMNWAPTTGTIWFQGKQPYVRDLYDAIEAKISARERTGAARSFS